jgi:PEP-CTERM motif
MKPQSPRLRIGQTFVARVSPIVAAATMTPRNFEGSQRPGFRSTALGPVRGAVAFLAAIIIAPAVAFAIGPNNQTVPDDTVNAMAQSLYATGLLSGPGGSGTGTVIGETAVTPTSPFGYVTIITANHVASAGIDTLTLGFDAAVNNAFTLNASVGAFQTYTIPAPQNTTGPPLLPVDISVMLATVNLAVGANRGNYNTLLAHTPTITNPTNNPLIPSPLANTTFNPPKLFSEVGYGIQGAFNPNIGGGGVAGYQYTAMSGQRLFQNNAVTAYTLAANSNTILAGGYPGYFEPFVRFQVLGPNTANTLGPGGANLPSYGGAALNGDSGSPLFTSGPSITFASGAGNLTMANTNSISAILVAGFPVTTIVGTALVNGSNEYAVPIDNAGLYNWIQGYAMNPTSIPEPGSAVLLGLGLLGYLAWRCSTQSPRRWST